MPNTNSWDKSVPVIAVLFCLSADLRAELPHGDEAIAAGKPAVAQHIRENFEYLDDRIVEIGDTVADQSNGLYQDVPLDCDDDPDAFKNSAINSFTTYILTGMCNGPIWISERHNITIKGDDAGDKDDGVILQANLVDHPYAVIGAWESENIALENLTVSAANYVNESYSFGENVATLGVGDGSHVEVLNVSFLGGDYSVNVYRNSVVRLEEVSVTGFNRTGLDAYMGGHIRTEGNITVTGIVDVSTDDWIEAINATANGTVDIRNGGTFTAGSTTRTVSAGGFDIYPVAVWAGDGGTIRVHGGSKPAVFNGGLESGYSGMIRVTGDTTIHGVVGVYHNSTMHLTDVVQDGGDIWVGDGGFLRVESSTLTPNSIYDSSINFSLYRAGRARVNNSTINMGNDDIDVHGISILDLRGSTSIGSADIDCGEYWNVQIRETVTRGSVSCWE